MRRTLPRPVLALALTVACTPPAPGPSHPPEVLTDDQLEEGGADVAAIVAGSNLPATLDAPLDGDGMAVTIHRLSNGITVYISPDTSKPRVSAWIAVRAGSRNDPPNSTGLAHYLEHMLFKGSDELGTTDAKAEQAHIDRIAELYGELRGTEGEARKKILAEIDRETQATAETAIPNEFDQLYQRMGIQGVNAFTSDDQTVYIADVPRNRLAAWARVEGERFQDPVFRLFYPELEAVYEEKNGTLDDPDSRVYETLLKQLFPEHPYGTQPTIGTVDHLKTPAYGDMEAYFDRWYRPNNVAIVLAGDVNADEALPILEKEFGAWKPKELEPPAPGKLRPVKGRQLSVVQAEGEEQVMIAWPTVPSGHPDEAAITVMDWLVDNSVSGLLNLELEVQQKVPNAGSYNSFELEAGYWVLNATARRGQSLDEVEGLLVGVVDKLKAGQFTQADLDAIVLNEELSEKRQMESNGARVSRMTEAWILRREWKDDVARIERLKTVTKKDVLRVAAKYLGDDRVVIQRKAGPHDPPAIDKPSITPIQIDPDRRSPFATSVLDMEAKPLTPEVLEAQKDYTVLPLKAGGRLIATPNARNDLFTVTYAYDVGSRDRALLCHATRLADRAGAGDLDAEALRKKLFALGSSIDLNCGDRNTVLTLSGVDRNLEETIRIADEWLSKPKFDADTVKRLLANTLSERRDSLTNPYAMSDAVSEFAQRGKESSWLGVASNKKLAKANGRTLKAELARLRRSTPDILYYGPRDAEAVRNVAPIGDGKYVLKRRPAVEYVKPGKKKIVFLHKAMAQAYVRTFEPRPPLPRERRPLAAVYEEYVSGSMGGLVFQEMREARGLAYSAWAGYAIGTYPDDESGRYGGINTQADKLVDAITTLDALLDENAHAERHQLSVDALEQAFRSGRIDPRWIAPTIDRWLDQGEKTDPRPWQWEQIQKVDRKTLDGFIGGLRDAPTVIAVLGDRNRLDLDALRAMGDFVEVTPEQVFGYGTFPNTAAK